MLRYIKDVEWRKTKQTLDSHEDGAFGSLAERRHDGKANSYRKKLDETYTQRDQYDVETGSFRDDEE